MSAVAEQDRVGETPTAGRAAEDRKAEREARAEDRRRKDLLKARMATDLGYAEQERERARRIRADRTLDPRLRDMYLDDTILDTRQVQELAGVGHDRVNQWRGPPVAEWRPQPHPRMLPPSDVILGRVWNRDILGIKRGKVIEWLIQGQGQFVWDAATGEVRRNPNPSRHGPASKHN